MSDKRSPKLQSYLDGLASVRVEDGSDEPIATEHQQAPPKPEDAPVARAHTPDEPVAPPVADAPAPVAELFPGYSNLPPETQASIKEKWEAAERLTREKAEAEHRFRQAQDRVGPTQQQLSKTQVENVRLQQELNELRSKKSDGAVQAFKAKIEARREQFPEDAELFDGMLSMLEQRGGVPADVAEKLKKVDALEQRLALQNEITQLSEAHPDWRKTRIALFNEPNGSQVVKNTVETDEAKLAAAWANGLDPHERRVIWPLLTSNKAEDASYVLTRFKHDLAIAQAEHQRVNGQHATPQAASASPTRVAPAADPDPSRRSTAPSSKTAGQPMSDKKRELIEAADFLRKRNEQKQKRA